MYDLDLKLERKRAWRFSCVMIGAGAIFLLFTATVVFCSNQLSAVSSVTLEAAPGEIVASGIPYLYFNAISYAAAVDGRGTPVERVGLYPEYQQSLEFICREGALITQSLDDPIDDASYPIDFRLVNECDRVVKVKICWWADSLFGLFLLPNCTI